MEEEADLRIEDDSELDPFEDKIDEMDAWEIGFERGVSQAENELFEPDEE